MDAEQRLRSELTEALGAPDAFTDPNIGEKNRRRAELTTSIEEAPIEAPEE